MTASIVFANYDLTGRYMSAPVIIGVIIISLVSGPVTSIASGVGLALFTDYFFLSPVGSVLSSVEGIEHLGILIGLTAITNWLAFSIRRTMIELQESRSAVARVNEELSRSQALFHAIVDQLPGFVTYFGTDERYHFVNKFTLDWFARRREDVIGGTIRDIVGDDYYKRIQERIRRALAGEVVRYDTELTTPDRVARVFQMEYTPDRDRNGKVRGVIVYGHDVSDLRQAIRAREEFIGIASHELKTPLTALAFSVDLMNRELQKGSLNKLTRHSEAAHKNVCALNDLINDMLDVTKIQSGQFNLRLQRTDLSVLVARVIDRMRDQLQEASCWVELELPPGVVGFWDRSRLEQVLANLISNSIKYAPNCVIRIVARIEGEEARLIVQDYGSGIPEKDQRRIFEAFQRGQAADGETHGLGLGLFVVRQIINSHHGEIKLESAADVGTKFTIRLPVYFGKSAPGTSGNILLPDLLP